MVSFDITDHDVRKGRPDGFLLGADLLADGSATVLARVRTGVEAQEEEGFFHGEVAHVAARGTGSSGTSQANGLPGGGDLTAAAVGGLFAAFSGDSGEQPASASVNAKTAATDSQGFTARSTFRRVVSYRSAADP